MATLRTKEFIDMICDALQRPAGSLTESDTPETVKEWDSLGQLSIIGLVDSLFHTPLVDESFEGFKSIGELVARLRQRGFLKDEA